MKIQKIALLLFSLLFSFGSVAGCAQSPDRLITPSPVITTPIVRTIASTETMLPTSTLTPAPTRTAKALSTATIVPTLPTSTPTVIPTLLAEDARQRLLDLLANNGECRLPCLWGITPGKSIYLEARSILVPLSSIAEIKHFTAASPANISPLHAEDITLLYVEDNSHVNPSVVNRLNTFVGYFFGTDGIVSNIGFVALEEEVTFDANGNWTTKRPILIFKLIKI